MGSDSWESNVWASALQEVIVARHSEEMLHMREVERNFRIGNLLERIEHLIKMIIRKEKKNNIISPFFVSLLSILKESERLHLSKVRETLVRAINSSNNTEEESEMSVTL